MIPLGPYFLAFILSSGLVLFLARLAPRWGLVDSPVGRKIHDGDVPLVGGIAIYLSFVIVTQFSGLMSMAWNLLVPTGVLVIVGVLDDLFECRARTKFAGQACAVLLMIGLGQVVLIDLGSLVAGGNLELGALSVPFTFICVIGLINALNFSDGADGLAGGIGVIALVWFAVLAGFAGNTSYLTLAVLFACSTLGFLIFNIRHRWQARARVFMGDAGSMMLGMVLAAFAISLSQGKQAVFPPIVAVWILGLPLLDTVSIMVRRMLRGKSPFTGDRAHLHHVLLDMGLSIPRMVVVMWVIAAVIGGAGVAAWQIGVSERVLFVAFLALFVAYGIGISYARSILRRSRVFSSTVSAGALITCPAEEFAGLDGSELK